MNTGIERECATKLLNDELTMAQRSQLMEGYFSQRMASTPVTDRRHVDAFRTGVAELIASVPAEQRPDLERILRETAVHALAERKQKSRRLATQLRSIAPGTAITVRDHSGEKSVVFCEMRRTRFMYERPDGRRYLAQLECFVRIEPGQPTRRVEDSSNPQPLQQQPRNAAGQDVTKPMTPSRDPKIVRGALDYIANFPRNQNKDPAQFWDDSIIDCDLKELIRQMIRMVSEEDNVGWFRKQVLLYPDATVRNLVLTMLDANCSDCASAD